MMMMLRGSEKWTFSQENSQLGLLSNEMPWMAMRVVGEKWRNRRRAKNSSHGKKSLRNGQLTCSIAECGLEETERDERMGLDSYHYD